MCPCIVMTCAACGQEDKSRSNYLICIKLELIAWSFKTSVNAKGFNVGESNQRFFPTILDVEVHDKCTKQRHPFTNTGNVALSPLENICLLLCSCVLGKATFRAEKYQFHSSFRSNSIKTSVNYWNLWSVSCLILWNMCNCYGWLRL